MQFGDGRLSQRRLLVRQGAHPIERVLVVEHLQMIVQRLATDGDAVLDQLRGLARRQRVAFDRGRAVGQLDIVIGAQRRDRAGHERPLRVQRRLEALDLFHRQNAAIPVIARPRISAWTSCAPS